jgi:hypothetical protein
MSRRLVPVARAIALYERFKSWSKVARVLRCERGISFQANSLFAAVRRYDLGKAK